MRRLSVNGIQQPFENLPDYWGKLLERIDRDADLRGEVVTAVRFDDVEQPAFREEALACPLTELDSIDVETTARRALIDDALAHGVISCHALATAARDARALLRAGDAAAACRALLEFGEGIRSLVVLVGAVAAACGTAFDSVETKGRSVSDDVNALIRQLEDVVAAQQADDWLTVADILEYEFEAGLEGWRARFSALRFAVSAVSEGPIEAV
jgi:hypothetical protein